MTKLCRPWRGRSGLSGLGSGNFVTSDILRLFVSSCCLFRGYGQPGRPGPTDGPELLRATDQTESQGRVPRDRRALPPGQGTKAPSGCGRTPRHRVESAVQRSADVCRVYATTCENAARGQRRATVPRWQCCAATRRRATSRAAFGPRARRPGRRGARSPR